MRRPKAARLKDERISIVAEDVRLPLTRAEIKRLVGRALALLDENAAIVCLTFVNDRRMRRLNFRYRRVDKPTDCLAFSMREGEDAGLNPQLLGDIVISAETAKRNARIFGSKVKDEIMLYVIHGMLHLLGFDDATVRAREKMRCMEEDILKRL